MRILLVLFHLLLQLPSPIEAYRGKGMFNLFICRCYYSRFNHHAESGMFIGRTRQSAKERTRNVASPTAPPPPSQRSKPEGAHADGTIPISAYYTNCLDFVSLSPCSPVETCSLSRDEKKEWSKRSHANVVIPMTIIYHT